MEHAQKRTTKPERCTGGGKGPCSVVAGVHRVAPPEAVLPDREMAAIGALRQSPRRGANCGSGEGPVSVFGIPISFPQLPFTPPQPPSPEYDFLDMAML